MKIGDIKGEKALDVLADLIMPISMIAQDKELVRQIRSGDKINGIKTVLKSHKAEIIEVLAILDGVTVKEYEVNLLTLPVKLMELFNDAELLKLFPSAAVSENGDGSLSASTTSK